MGLNTIVHPRPISRILVMRLHCVEILLRILCKDPALAGEVFKGWSSDTDFAQQTYVTVNDEDAATKHVTS